MFTFFKKSVSPAGLASALWENIEQWPAENGAYMEEAFSASVNKSIDEVLDEVVYLLAFSADYALLCQLKDKPNVLSAVRDAFLIQVADFADERHCSFVPVGDWLGDSLIWIPSSEIPIDAEQPLANLKRRFAMYAHSLSRHHERSAGERTAHLLAAFCGTQEIAFIVYAASLFADQWTLLQKILGSFKVKI